MSHRKWTKHVAERRRDQGDRGGHGRAGVEGGSVGGSNGNHDTSNGKFYVDEETGRLAIRRPEPVRREQSVSPSANGAIADVATTSDRSGTDWLRARRALDGTGAAPSTPVESTVASPVKDTDKGAKARALLGEMVAEAREPDNYERQFEIADVFAEIEGDSGLDFLEGLLASGLHNSLMERYADLKETSTDYGLSLDMYNAVFEEIGHGIALTYVNKEDALLTGEHVSELIEVDGGPREGIVSPSGVIVNKAGEIVLIFATALVPYQVVVNETIAGMRDFAERFDYLCNGVKGKPQLLLISARPKQALKLDRDVEHEQVIINHGEIVEYTQENIF